MGSGYPGTLGNRSQDPELHLLRATIGEQLSAHHTTAVLRCGNAAGQLQQIFHVALQPTMGLYFDTKESLRLQEFPD